MNLQVLLTSFWVKLDEVLGSVYGCIVALTFAIINFLVGYKLAFIAVLVCILFDAIFGIWAALKQGKYAKSELFRDTFSKVFGYGGALVVIAFIEKLIGLDTPICMSICSSMICATEFWSMAGNALIVNPNLAFFRLIKSALRGEIARKMNISEDDVDEALKKRKKVVKTKSKEDTVNEK